ncbi:hypothetical protein MFLAVUS_008005 [Mucor flavus]|uniref:Tc1-like transposase DDE domain-containing protein n=1 Tax=Mucor flavus TaxID=439312 RepID=A0ABP9Z5Z3_9FUNG
MDFLNNCVFIDESGFSINLKSSRAWAPRGESAVVTTPLTKAPTHSIIEAISTVGVVNLSIRIPPTPSKIRKIQGGNKRKIPDAETRKTEPTGTTTGHYLRFLNDTLDIMDKQDSMKDFYLIMDNAPIHTSKAIEQAVKRRNRDYKCVYLPPYSPELNPIEQFWALIKRKVKRNKLDGTDTLELRIIEAANEIPIQYLINMVQHSKDHFLNSLNKTPI